MRDFLFCCILLFSSSTFAKGNALFTKATLETSKGPITLKLFKKDAPNYVDNFVGLATGKKDFRDTNTGKKIKDTVFYKNMVFHKVHPELGIQTGCPWGNGKGWPGYTVKEEVNELKFDRPYLVAMAKIEGDNNSIGSQFFITAKPAPHLDGKYTIIGEVEKGFKVVDEIASVKRDAMMKPLKPVKLEKILIEE